MGKAFYNKDWVTRFLVLAIVLLALILRMAWPTLTPFKRDEATVTRLALAIAYEGYLPATGVDTSTGTDNLPLTLYLLAIPLRLWADPVAAVLFTGLLNGLAVLACYGLGQAYFGRGVGLVAAFLFAVSPWAVLYGRKIWCQNLPLITIGFIASLLAAFTRGKRWALVGAFVGLAALIGLHLGGLAFIPVLLLTMLIYRKQVALKPLLVGVGLFALALSPYVIQDALNGWPNLRDFLSYAGGEGRFSMDALRYAFFMMGSEEVPGRMAGGLHQEYLAGLPNLWWLNWAMMVLLAVALLYAVRQVFWGPREQRQSILVLLIWFAVPIAMQTRPTAPVHPFYFNLLYPVQFLIVAILLTDIVSRFPRSRFAPFLLIGALLVWGVWQVAVVGRVLLFMDRHPTTGGYGIPLKYTRATAREAKGLVGSPDAEIVVLSTGISPKMHETPAVFEALLFGYPHRFADGRQALPVPDCPEVVYIVGPLGGESGVSEFAPTMSRLEALNYVEDGPVVVLPDSVSYRLFHRGAPDREDVLDNVSRFSEAIPFANGTVFLGRDVPQEVASGQTLDVWLVWWVRSLPPDDVKYHLFAHLLSRDSSLRGQYDGAGFPTSSWRAGDLVLSHFPIPVSEELPAGRYQVWGGQYSYPDVINVSFLDVAGNPAGDRVLLGEVVVR